MLPCWGLLSDGIYQLSFRGILRVQYVTQSAGNEHPIETESCAEFNMSLGLLITNVQEGQKICCTGFVAMVLPSRSH